MGENATSFDSPAAKSHDLRKFDIFNSALQCSSEWMIAEFFSSAVTVR